MEPGGGVGGVVLVDEVVDHASEVVVDSLEDVAAGDHEGDFLGQVAGGVDHDAPLLDRFGDQPPLLYSRGERGGVQREYLLQVPDTPVDEFG